MRILVAEDDRATRARLVACLREWGHEPLPAADGEEAWEIFQGGGIHLVLSDWLMPKLNGLELLRRIRAGRGGGGGGGGRGYVYVILLTSRSDKDDLVEAMEAGADDFVNKPFDRDELRARLRAGERVIDLEAELEAKNAVLLEANQRMAANLQEAATVQEAFLPQGSPPAGGGVDWAWVYRPCDGLAGDMFNLVPLGERHLGVYMVDVSGHGVAAALLSVHVSRVLTQRGAALLRGAEGELTPPPKVAEELNRRFAFRSQVHQYFTFLYGVLDLQTGTFRYTSAGHPGPILVGAGEPVVREATPPAVGFFDGATFTEQQLELAPGDRLLLYTDGIFEVYGESDEIFGEGRLAEICRNSRASPLKECLEKLQAGARAWVGGEDPDDDVSVLALEFQGPGGV